MRGDEYLNALLASGGENLPHVGNHIELFERRPAEFVQLTALRQEIVVRVDDDQASQFGLVRGFGTKCHGHSAHSKWDELVRPATAFSSHVAPSAAPQLTNHCFAATR